MNKSILIKRIVGETLKKAGLRKKADSWYLSSDEVVGLLNLQKSQYSDAYFINIGFLLEPKNSAIFPKEHQCDIRLRLTSLVDESFKKEIDSIFDLECESFSDEERRSKISEIVARLALPLLDDCATLSGVKECYKNGRFAKSMINRKAKSLLE